MIGPILSTLDPQPSTIQAGLPGAAAGSAAPTATGLPGLGAGSAAQTAQSLPGQVLPGSGAATLPGATGSALGSGTTAAPGTSPSSSAAAASASDVAGTDTFLKLLVAQLQNQNPMQPMDDQSFITELAQFNTVEQMLSLKQSMDTQTTAQQATEGVALIGKTVTYAVPGIGQAGATTNQGTVGGVATANNAVQLQIDGQNVPLSQVLAVSPAVASQPGVSPSTAPQVTGTQSALPQAQATPSQAMGTQAVSPQPTGSQLIAPQSTAAQTMPPSTAPQATAPPSTTPQPTGSQSQLTVPAPAGSQTIAPPLMAP